MTKKESGKKSKSTKDTVKSSKKGLSGGTIAKGYRDSLGMPASDARYNVKKDPPEQVMELIRGDPDQMERYGHYMRLLSDDPDLDLNMLECHRLSVIFVNLDRFKNWELSKDREEWVDFLKQNYSVADLMRKYEQYALDYLQKHKMADMRPSSVFDQAKSIMAEFRGGSGELKIEWKGEQELVMEGEVIDSDYKGHEEVGEAGLGGSEDIPQFKAGDEVTPEDGKGSRRRDGDAEGDD